MDNATASATPVYQYFDAHDVLIYVGITSRGSRRQDEHNKTKAWWQYVDRQTVEHYSTRLDALARESELILRHRPPFNTQQNPTAKEARASYAALLDLLAQQPDPIPVAQACGRRIPVLLTYRNHDVVELLTPIEYATVVMNLDLTGQPKAMVDTTKCGMVVGLNRQGGHALLTLKVRSGALIDDPYVRIRQETTKAGARFEVRNVQLSHSH